MTTSTLRLSLAVAVFTACPGLAAAAVDENQVRSFFDDATAEAEQLAEAGDWQGVREWTRQHLAEEATLAVTGAMIGRTGPVISYSASLDRQDLSRLASMAMMSPQDMGEDAIEDYRLQTEVLSVSELPDGTATARVRFQETATVDLSEMAKVAAADGARARMAEAAAIPSRTTVQSTSTCEFRLGEGGAAGVEIQIAACESTTSF